VEEEVLGQSPIPKGTVKSKGNKKGFYQTMVRKSQALLEETKKFIG